jgi:outer membrane protein
MKKILATLGLTITTLLTPISAYAEWSYGIAGIGSLTPYKGLDSETRIFPIASYEGERVIWRGPSIQYKLTGLKRGEPSLRMRLDMAPNELEASESRELTGIRDRDFSFLAGISYIYPTQYGELSAMLQTDVTNKHNGQRAAFNFDRVLLQAEKRQWAITAGVQLEYLSDNYADYYYGVSQAEAALSAFAQYEVDAVWQGGLTLGGYYQFNQHWMAVIQTRYLQLDDEITNSPIVSGDYTVDGFVGVTYQF